MMNYSLSGQDDWVLDITQNKMNGVFLDLGCGNGVTYNNTYKLEVEYNWTGVCVDKNYQLYIECSNSRNVTCINKEIVLSDNDVKDPSQITINNLIETYLSGLSIDYISINLNEVPLEIVRSIDFDQIDVKLITLQHNRYKKLYNGLDPFHYFLTSKNFERKFIDVTGLVEENEKFNQPYEDWFYNKSFFN